VLVYVWQLQFLDAHVRVHLPTKMPFHPNIFDHLQHKAKRLLPEQ
jgi:hypothetical protein